MPEDTKDQKGYLDPRHWTRIAYMILFVIINYPVRLVINVIALGQFVFVLVSGETNKQLLEFGQSLSRYSYDIMRFISYNSDEKPFPFASWPEGE